MDAYLVTVDKARCLITLTMRGFWDEATFDRFAAAYVKALGELRDADGCTHALVDGREFAVQSTEIAQRFQELITAMAPISAKRTATVVPAQLNKMQAERTGGALQVRMFSDMAEAGAWLFSDDE
jgi:hypothetical protein